MTHERDVLYTKTKALSLELRRLQECRGHRVGTVWIVRCRRQRGDQDRRGESPRRRVTVEEDEVSSRHWCGQERPRPRPLALSAVHGGKSESFYFLNIFSHSSRSVSQSVNQISQPPLSLATRKRLVAVFSPSPTSSNLAAKPSGASEPICCASAEAVDALPRAFSNVPGDA